MDDKKREYYRNYKRKWREENPDQEGEYRRRTKENAAEAVREARLEYHRDYYRRTKDRQLEQARQRYQRDKDKIKARTKAYRERNKERYRENRAKKRDELVAWWFGEIMPSLKCKHCGDSTPTHLNFHHREMRKPGDKRRRHITTMLHGANSKSAILAEMEKCDVLCANCHADEHARLRGYPGL